MWVKFVFIYTIFQEGCILFCPLAKFGAIFFSAFLNKIYLRNEDLEKNIKVIMKLNQKREYSINLFGLSTT